MPVSRTRYALIVAVVGLLVAAVLLWPIPASAQCGTQASSCKNCHEVQRQDPVNTNGAWHVDHAFGDFCEFCHSGNVTATDKDAAHQGMIYPLDDVKASCSSCHPTDYENLAGQYASTLGVSVGTGTSGGAAATGGDGTPAAAATEAPSTVDSAAAPQENSEVASSGQVYDLTSRYDNKVAAESKAPVNVGNVILSVMLVGLVGAFGVLAWHFEGIGDRFAELRGKAKEVMTTPTTADLESQAMQQLRPALEKANPATLAALSKLLESDPERGGQMIEALARIDPRLVEAVRRLDQQDLDLLIVLVRELNERNK